MQALPFENLAQFTALGFTLISGWFFGLASSSRGRKWRARYHEEAVEHAGYRDQAENDLRTLNQRIQELESELRVPAEPIATPTPAPTPLVHAAGVAAVVAEAAADVGAEPVHAEPAPEQDHAADPAPALADIHVPITAPPVDHVAPEEHPAPVAHAEAVHEPAEAQHELH